MEEFRKNIVLLDIFYGKMSFQRLEEDLAYDGLDMIGEWYTTSTSVPYTENNMQKIASLWLKGNSFQLQCGWALLARRFNNSLAAATPCSD